MKPRISMIALAVEDLTLARQFYEEGLGFPKMESPPGIVFFNLNGTWLGLSPRKALAEDAGISEVGSGYRGFNLAHNVPSEEEVNKIADKAVAAGAMLIKAPTKSDWGGYHAYFSDPDGHIWEIAYNPFAWVGPTDDQT